MSEEGVYSTLEGVEKDGVKLIISNPDDTQDSIILYDVFNCNYPLKWDK